MSTLKDVAAESGLMINYEAPVQQIKKEAIEAAVNRMRYIVPNGKDMSVEHLTVIAQEAILYRVVPGRDMHYFVSRGQLQRIPDYKYLKNFATFKEQMLSGDSTASLDDVYRTLNDEDKIKHGIPTDYIAAECKITTARERRQFAHEVKTWRELGFDPGEAVAMAREVAGDVGTTAIGAIDPNEKDRSGKPIEPPKGWSLLQLAEKLAFKNAVNRKYGIPTADEMSAMAYAMARRAGRGDWKPENVDKPIDVQARLADLEAQARQAKEEIATQTPEQRQMELDKRVDLMRGPEDNIIGDDWQQPELIEPAKPDNDKIIFYSEVKRRIPYYGNASIDEALEEMGILFDPENVDFIFEQLDTHANEAADAKEV